MIKDLIKRLIRFTPFYPRHIGSYIRNLYFWKCIKKLPVKNFTYVLDAGCGGGEYTQKLAIRYPHLNINAYDIKKHESWNDSFKNINFKQKDLLTLEEENYYDFCLCIDVLEHIPENRLLFWEQEDFESLEKVVTARIRYYNQIRRHSALGNKSPIHYLKEKGRIPR